MKRFTSPHNGKEYGVAQATDGSWRVVWADIIGKKRYATYQTANAGMLSKFDREKKVKVMPTFPAKRDYNYIREFNAGEKRQIIKLHKAGKTDKEVAEIIGTKHYAVRNFLVHAGERITRKSKPKVSDNLREIMKMVKNGYSHAQIANKFGCSKQHIQQIVKGARK